jgi:hypothetical protein
MRAFVTRNPCFERKNGWNDPPRLQKRCGDREKNKKQLGDGLEKGRSEPNHPDMSKTKERELDILDFFSMTCGNDHFRDIFSFWNRC